MLNRLKGNPAEAILLALAFVICTLPWSGVASAGAEEVANQTALIPVGSTPPSGSTVTIPSVGTPKPPSPKMAKQPSPLMIYKANAETEVAQPLRPGGVETDFSVDPEHQPVAFNGGLIQHNPHIYLVFWGSEWNSHSGTREKLIDLYQWLGSSSSNAYLGILRQYFDYAGPFESAPTLSYVTDTTTTPPEIIFDSQVKEEAYRMIEKQPGWESEYRSGGYENQYVVALPPATHDGASMGCGYHAWSGNPWNISYTYLPWEGNPSYESKTADCLREQEPWGELQVAASHEFAESVTDPIPESDEETEEIWYGWSWINEDGEVADMCDTVSPAEHAEVSPGIFATYLFDDYIAGIDGTENGCQISDSPERFRSGTSYTPLLSEATHKLTIYGSLYPAGWPTKYQFEIATPHEGTRLEPAKFATLTERGATGLWSPATSTPVVGEARYVVTLKGISQITESLGGVNWHTGWPYPFAEKSAEIITPDWRPTVETAAPLEQVGGHANLQGSLKSHGYSTSYRWDWGPTEKYGSSFSGEIPGEVSTKPVGHSITGLKGETSYYYRLWAHNVEGEHELSGKFTTPNWKPTLNLGTTTSHPGTVVLQPTVNPQGFSTKYSLGWGKAASCTTELAKCEHITSPATEISGETPQNVGETFSAKGLTTYYYRLQASNIEGENTPLGGSYTTPDWRPSPVSGSASTVLASRGTVSGTVNPTGFASTFTVEYGPTTSYGSSSPLENNAVGSGEVAVPVSVALTGLQPETLYHYRISATNVEGTKQSTDKTFSTTRSVTLCAVEAPFCGGANQRATGTSVSATATGSTILSGSALTVSCTSSTLSGSTPGEAGHPFSISPFGIVYSGCTYLGFPVTFESLHTPYSAALIKGEKGYGSFELEGVGGSPQLRMKIALLSYNCLYQAVSVKYQLSAGKPAKLTPEATFNRMEGNETQCGKSLSVTAAYQLNSPTPAYAEPVVNSVLCKKGTVNICPAESVLPSETGITGQLRSSTVASFQGSGKVECSKSTLAATSQAKAGAAVPLSITGLTFSSCTGCASVTAAGLPYVMSLERLDLKRANIGLNGSLKSSHPYFSFSGCGAGIAAAAGAVEVKGTMEGGTPALIVIKSAPLPLGVGMFAAEPSMSFTATYEITSPASLFLENET